MSEVHYILKPANLIWVVVGYFGVGVLMTLAVMGVTFLQDRAVCRLAGPGDLARLKAIEGVGSIGDDDDEIHEKDKEEGEEDDSEKKSKPNEKKSKKSKKEA